MWLHCIHSTGTKKLIFSPDTDVYHVGLSFAPLLEGMEVVIQLSKSFREGLKFLLLHYLLQALQSDPDLQGVSLALRPQTLQSLDVCTGCDEHIFLICLIHCWRIGTIGDLEKDTTHLSFLHLVCATYLRAHASVYITNKLIPLFIY